MGSDKLTRQSFEAELSQNISTNWTGRVKEILCGIHMEDKLANLERINLIVCPMPGQIVTSVGIFC